MNTSLCIGAEDLGRKEKGFEQDQHGFPDNLCAEAISRSNSLFPQMFAKEEIGLKQSKTKQTKIKPVLVSHKENLDWKRK